MLKVKLQVLNHQKIIRRNIGDKEDEEIKININIYLNNTLGANITGMC